jgi:hypothetical protein
MATFSLDSFKDAVNADTGLRDSLAGTTDVIDFDNGTALIYREHLDKYLEKYSCKNENDLLDTLWYSYGVYAKII